MEDENLYRSIYEYLMARIYFGYYPKGEYLPSIHKLGDLFGVSTITVRAALRLLEQDGYIHTQKNKRTEVLLDPPGPPRAFPGELLLKEEIQRDLYSSFELIFPKIFYCGLSACGGQELLELSQILERPSHSWDEPTVNFLAHIVKGLKNSLALGLFYDVMLFSYPTYLAMIAREPGSWKQAYADLYIKFKSMLKLNRSGDREALWLQVRESYATFCSHSVPPGQCLLRSTPYRWRKPQICLSTATNLIRQVILGIYPPGSFLPSARILAEESSTAVITMRRAIVLLNDLGVTESINGRGTRVLSMDRGPQEVCWDKPTVKKNLMNYLESLHLLAITCRDVAESIFPGLSPADKAQALEALSLASSGGRVGMILYIYPNILIKAMEGTALREIYSQLLGQLILGLPLSYLKPHLQLECFAARLASSFEGQDSHLFAAELEQLLKFTFLASREMMVQVGIYEAARLVLPVEED